MAEEMSFGTWHGVREGAITGFTGPHSPGLGALVLDGKAVTCPVPQTGKSLLRFFGSTSLLVLIGRKIQYITDEKGVISDFLPSEDPPGGGTWESVLNLPRPVGEIAMEYLLKNGMRWGDDLDGSNGGYDDEEESFDGIL